MYFGERELQWLIFSIFFWNWTLSVHVKPEHIFRPIGLPNTFYRVATFEGMIWIFLQGVDPAVAVVIAKIPYSNTEAAHLNSCLVFPNSV